MKLSDAIKSLVEEQGIQALNCARSLNILQDYNAFVDFPASKIIIRVVLEGEIGKSIIREYTKGGNLIPLANRIVSILSVKYGFREDIAVESLNSILIGLGETHLLSSPPDSSQSNKRPKTSTARPIPLQKSAGDNHLLFKGFYINGSVDDIHRMLAQDGFVDPIKWDNYLRVEGTFAGYSPAYIYLYYPTITNRIYHIEVCLGDRIQFKKEDIFENIKHGLINKYGKYQEDNNGDLIFSLINGNITLHFCNATGVWLYYTDKLNYEMNNQTLCSNYESDL